VGLALLFLDDYRPPGKIAEHRSTYSQCASDLYSLSSKGMAG
jgi:hypothetical protein